jgi:thioredoxin-like negative regulator of GroEL
MVKLSQFMAETEGSPKIARVDCRASKGLCNTFRADKLPYMLLFRNRHVYKYEGAINAEQIEAFLAEGFQAH